LKERLNLIEACEKAAEIVSHAHEMDRLYHRAVQCLGEGELRMGILSMAAEAVEDESLRDEVFISDDSMLSFLCGIWIQFLLIEIAGVKKEKLRALAQKVFMDINEGQSCH